jgi:hypothetical protein
MAVAQRSDLKILTSVQDAVMACWCDYLKVSLKSSALINSDQTAHIDHWHGVLEKCATQSCLDIGEEVYEH